MRLSASVVLLVAATLALPAAAQSAPAARGTKIDFFRLGVPKDRVAGVALLKLKGLDAHELIVSKNPLAKNALKDLMGRTGVDVTLIRPIALGWAFVEVREHNSAAIPDEAKTMALIDRLASDEAVEAVSDDKWMRPLLTPNDPGLPQMWHFDIIGARAAWDKTQGLSSQRVGIIDTGLVRSHEDVGNRAVAGFDFVSSTQSSNDGNGRDADFNDPGDGCGGQSSFHGTHVAGTIGARANNGVGVAGLNWNAGLVIGRALGCFGGDLVDIGEAAVWMAGGAVDNVAPIGANKVSVMNLSLGSDGACSQFEQQVVDFVNQQGAIFVAAAGNSSGGGFTAPVGSPASCNGSVAVGAHGPDRTVASYSSFGPEVAIVAPGGDFAFGQEGGVLSTIGPSSNLYTFLQGTSMAAPHVTGSISLMQALNPSLTRAQIVSILQSTGTSCAGCGTKKAMVLDAALNAVPTGGTTPPPPPPPTGTDDTLEENDSFDTAKTGVTCGARLNLVASAADQDWFLLDTVPGESIDISISSTNGADLDLYVLDGPTNNDVVGASESPTGNESVHIDADGTQLHVLINPFVDTQNNVQNNGPYAISVDCVGGPTTDPTDPTDPSDPSDPSDPTDPDPTDPTPPTTDDDSEPNDTIDSAVEMFCDESRDLVALDDDFYIVEVRAHDTLTAQVTSQAALTTQILNTNGLVFAEGDASSAATAADLPAGHYVVKVSPSGAGGTYSLKTGCGAGIAANGGGLMAKGGCSSTGEAAAPMALALLGLAFTARRRRAGR